MKNFLVKYLVVGLLLLSGCAPKVEYSQYYSEEGHFKAVLPDVENVTSSCKTENDIKRCVAIASDKNIGAFFVYSAESLSGAYAGLSNTELLNISSSFIDSQCRQIGFMSRWEREPRMTDLLAKSQTYRAVSYERLGCSGDSGLIGYTINLENTLYMIYVMGEKALFPDNASVVHGFFRSFEYVP
jgi:hypothetical protein